MQYLCKWFIENLSLCESEGSREEGKGRQPTRMRLQESSCLSLIPGPVRVNGTEDAVDSGGWGTVLPPAHIAQPQFITPGHLWVMQFQLAKGSFGGELRAAHCTAPGSPAWGSGARSSSCLTESPVSPPSGSLRRAAVASEAPQSLEPCT